MKARVKATGDIVDATYWNTSANGIKYYDIDNSGYTMTEDELDFDLSYTPDYWEKLKHQYAGMVMKKQKFEVELVYPAKYGAVTDARLLHIIEKGMIGREWGIAVTELNLIEK